MNSGASCPGSGTSGSPYCSFSSINSLDLAPGDRVLLARGATFNVSTGPSLTLGDEDDGSSVSWNSVEPYGSGADPIISGASAASTTGIVGTNLDYWKFVEIEFTNASAAITITYTTITHQGLRFQKLYVHDMLDTNPWTGTGVYLKTPSASPPVPTSTQWVAKDIQFTDNEFGPIGLSLAVDGLNSTKLETFQDILFMRNYTHDMKWDEAFRYNKNVKWIGNRNEQIGSGFLSGGTTDLHLWALTNATFVNSTFNYVYDSGSADQTIGDLAYRLDQTRFRNNLIENAAGPGLEWHVWRTSDDYGLDPSANYYTNQEVSGNAFRNNGWAPWMAGTSYQGSLALIPGPCSTLPTGSVEQNLYWEPTGFFSANGCSNPLTMTNNLSIGASASIYHAGRSFSDTACSAVPEWAEEKSTDGTSWTAMLTVSTVNPRTDVRCINGSGTPWVNRFEQFPNTGTSYTVARTWTAPSDGEISIRSRALKAELGGDGVNVRVTKNGTAIIGPSSLGASDQVGVVLNADSIAVNAGDKIRFEVDDKTGNTSDRISWSPVVAFATGGGGGGGGDSSLVTAHTVGSPRNDTTNDAGMRVTVGASAITVTQIGRYFFSGNSQTHTLRIVRASDGVQMASESINMGAGTADNLGFKYATLATPVVLAANTTYYVVSSEVNGGDQFADSIGTDQTPSSVATLPGSVYGFWVENGDSSNDSYGPMNLKYTIGGGGGGETSFVTGNILGGILRNDATNDIGMQVAVGASAITVTQLGRYFVTGNSGTHTLKIVRKSDGVTIGSVSINMGAGVADGLGYKYATLATAVTLSANTTYYIVSSEVNGGDQWYDSNGTSVTTTSVASVPGSVYGFWVENGWPGESYGPMNFKYQ